MDRNKYGFYRIYYAAEYGAWLRINYGKIYRNYYDYYGNNYGNKYSFFFP